MHLDLAGVRALLRHHQVQAHGGDRRARRNDTQVLERDDTAPAELFPRHADEKVLSRTVTQSTGRRLVQRVVLRDGRVEQIGSPMELYNNPANQFVAGFLGSPSMNFFNADLVGEGDNHTIGIRPEDLFVADDGALNATVMHVEQLGGDTNVVARLNSHQITARLFGQHDVEEGTDIRFGYAPERMYRFDQEGARLG